MSQTKHIAEWLKQFNEKTTIEVRFRTSEIVDSVEWDQDCDGIAEDLQDIAMRDARDHNRTRVYTVFAITENGERHECRIRLRCRVAGQGDGSQSAQTLVDTAIKLVNTVMSQSDRLAARLERNEDRNDAVYDLLDKLRNESLERDIKREKHEKGKEMIDRGLDAGIPLALAIASKWTGGALPAPDVKTLALGQIIKAMTESQLDNLKLITGDLWPELAVIIEAGLNGQPDVRAFNTFVKKLSPERMAAIAGIMNVGQQAALQEVIDKETLALIMSGGNNVSQN